MLSNNTKLSVKTGEKVYEFHCDPFSPLGEIHDALAKMKQFVVDKILEVQANEPKVAPPPEPVKEG